MLVLAEAFCLYVYQQQFQHKSSEGSLVDFEVCCECVTLCLLLRLCNTHPLKAQTL